MMRIKIIKPIGKYIKVLLLLVTHIAFQAQQRENSMR